MTSESRIKRAGFPLEQWFDLSNRISRSDMDLCEAQMLLYAVKDNIDPEGPEAQKEIGQMKRAVKLHNRTFDRK